MRDQDVGDSRYTRPGPLDALQEALLAALCKAHLHHAVVLVDGIHHPLGRLDGVGDGLLDVSVFPRLAGRHQDGRVPVIRRGDQHRIHVLAFQNAPVIVIGVHLARMCHEIVQSVSGHVAAATNTWSSC